MKKCVLLVLACLLFSCSEKESYQASSSGENKFLGTWKSIEGGKIPLEITFYANNRCLVKGDVGQVDMDVPYSYTDKDLVIDIYDFTMKFMSEKLEEEGVFEDLKKELKESGLNNESILLHSEPTIQKLADFFVFKYLINRDYLTLTNNFPKYNVIELRRK